MLTCPVCRLDNPLGTARCPDCETILDGRPRDPTLDAPEAEDLAPAFELAPGVFVASRFRVEGAPIEEGGAARAAGVELATGRPVTLSLARGLPSSPVLVQSCAEAIQRALTPARQGQPTPPLAPLLFAEAQGGAVLIVEAALEGPALIAALDAPALSPAESRRELLEVVARLVEWLHRKQALLGLSLEDWRWTDQGPRLRRALEARLRSEALSPSELDAARQRDVAALRELADRLAAGLAAPWSERIAALPPQASAGALLRALSDAPATPRAKAPPARVAPTLPSAAEQRVSLADDDVDAMTIRSGAPNIHARREVVGGPHFIPEALLQERARLQAEAASRPELYGEAQGALARELEEDLLHFGVAGWALLALTPGTAAGLGLTAGLGVAVSWGLSRQARGRLHPGSAGASVALAALAPALFGGGGAALLGGLALAALTGTRVSLTREQLRQDTSAREDALARHLARKRQELQRVLARGRAAVACAFGLALALAPASKLGGFDLTIPAAALAGGLLVGGLSSAPGGSPRDRRIRLGSALSVLSVFLCWGLVKTPGALALGFISALAATFGLTELFARGAFEMPEDVIEAEPLLREASALIAAPADIADPRFELGPIEARRAPLKGR